MSIVLADQTFPSWAQARKYHLTLMHVHRAKAEAAGKPYRSIIRFDHHDFPFLHALFALHHDRKKKLKGGTLHYFEFAPDHGSVRTNSKNWCCYVINKSNERMKWSAKHIGESKQKKREDDLRGIFRLEVSGQRDNFAKKHPWVVHCAECACELRNTKSGATKTAAVRASIKRSMRTANVDHDVTAGQAFLTTYQQFRKHVNGNKLKFTWTERYGRNLQVLRDRDLARSWRRYHKKKTVFRFLCTTCNNQSHNKPKRRKRKK